MSKYPKAKMPDYGDGPEPCDDCAYKDKRIAELEDDFRTIVIRANGYAKRLAALGEDANLFFTALPLMAEGGGDE